MFKKYTKIQYKNNNVGLKNKTVGVNLIIMFRKLCERNVHPICESHSFKFWFSSYSTLI